MDILIFQYKVSQIPLVIGKTSGICIVLISLFVVGTVAAYYPLVGVALILPIVFSILYYRNPSLFTQSFIVTLGFGAFLNLPFTSGGFPVSTAILITGFMLWCVAALFRKDVELILTFFRRPEHLIVSIFLLLMIVSLMNSNKVPASVKQIQLYIYCWLIFFFLQMVLRERKYLEKAISWVVIGGLLVGILGLVEIAIGQSLYWVLGSRSILMADVSEVLLNAHAGRINGLIGDAPFHGMYMVIIACLSLYKVITAGSRRIMAGYGLIFILSGINVLLSASRGAVIAFILAFLFIWAFLEIRGKWIILGGICVTAIFILLIVVVTMPDMNVDRLYSNEARSGQTAEMRLQHIPVAFDMFLDHPIIGLGPDGFALNYSKYATEYTSDAHQMTVMKTHNTPLQIMAEYGLIGMGLLTVFSLLTVSRLWTAMHSKADIRMRYLALTLLGSLVGYLFFLCTSNSLLDKNLWMVVTLAQCVFTLHEDSWRKTVEN